MLTSLLPYSCVTLLSPTALWESLIGFIKGQTYRLFQKLNKIPVEIFQSIWKLLTTEILSFRFESQLPVSDPQQVQTGWHQWCYANSYQLMIWPLENYFIIGWLKISKAIVTFYSVFFFSLFPHARYLSVIMEHMNEIWS